MYDSGNRKFLTFNWQIHNLHFIGSYMNFQYSWERRVLWTTPHAGEAVLYKDPCAVDIEWQTNRLLYSNQNNSGFTLSNFYRVKMLVTRKNFNPAWQVEIFVMYWRETFLRDFFVSPGLDFDSDWNSPQSLGLIFYKESGWIKEWWSQKWWSGWKPLKKTQQVNRNLSWPYISQRLLSFKSLFYGGGVHARIVVRNRSSFYWWL